jgi:hypothetical protein
MAAAHWYNYDQMNHQHPSTATATISPRTSQIWGLYSTVAPLEVHYTCTWSGGVNDNGPVTYISVMEHGGLAFVLV